MTENNRNTGRQTSQNQNDSLFIPLRLNFLREYYEKKQRLYGIYGRNLIDSILLTSSFSEGVEGLMELEEMLTDYDTNSAGSSLFRSHDET